MTIRDQIGTVLSFDQMPKRIVSLVPSQTELLVDMGARATIVGITKFCVHPKHLRKEKAIVGGTKKVNLDVIANLNPDVILCNKEENTKEMVTLLQKIAPVHVSDVKTVDDSIDLIHQYGLILNEENEANRIVNAIEAERVLFSQRKIERPSFKKVGYVIWKEPLMVAGADTFIDALLEEVGFTNAFKSYPGRYPEVQWDDFKELDYIFLSSEPFPFKESHVNLFREQSNAEVHVVNGEYFSWYGSRLIKAYSYFKDLQCKLE